MTRLSNLTPGTKAYSSVQHGNGEDDHFELNSDLLFGEPPFHGAEARPNPRITVNHSCTPNVAFDLSHPRTSEGVENSQYPTEWNLRTLSRPIAKGETLTFFYPSTEWDMGAPFTCACGESVRSVSHSSSDAGTLMLWCVCRTAWVRSRAPSI